MKSVKITANAIVNVNGRGEKFKGDVIHNISDDLAAHFVNDCQVAEYLDAPSIKKEEQPDKPGKPRKSPKQQFDDAEAASTKQPGEPTTENAEADNNDAKAL